MPVAKKVVSELKWAGPGPTDHGVEARTRNRKMERISSEAPSPKGLLAQFSSSYSWSGFRQRSLHAAAIRVGGHSNKAFITPWIVPPSGEQASRGSRHCHDRIG